MANLKFITPFLDELGHCLSIGQAPSQGLVYALDSDIVIKLPFQYIIPDDLDDDAIFYINHGVRSFVAMERELARYDAAANRRHPNIARRLKVDSSDCLFLERLQPLEQTWVNADEKICHRWVRELLDGICWLEELGFTQGDMAVRNLAVDSSNHLKLFDFGSATTQHHYDYAADVKRDHFGLATCLHYILTGVDPFANVYSVQEVRQIETQLLEGCGTVGAGAEILTNVIQAGWTGQAALTKFSKVKEHVEVIIGVAGLETASKTSEEHYQRLESRCAEWLKRATLDQRWMDPDDYCAACRAKGYETEMDIWR
ncbi:uncharacterized protein LY89DRAFT_691758 [Mollisia scopiformis]|uniref:Protein kinase domain-containing protein n=1 Tax=Mollisia scopiformis TaxID=149040 RepID=A0A132B4H1_MOLSC|nr:uncharacterized protein LY89DRAFT_691758 [Mollisia scopiformis]KUJ07290.1 hypothetical protein LY89DRAFT_691758 [Mollisia scopiformis]